jgi:hypothetical protein
VRLLVAEFGAIKCSNKKVLKECAVKKKRMLANRGAAAEF